MKDKEQLNVIFQNVHLIISRRFQFLNDPRVITVAINVDRVFYGVDSTPFAYRPTTLNNEFFFSVFDVSKITS